MKIWAVILLLAIGMALFPELREKSAVTNKVVVAAVGVDMDSADSCHMSVQAIETLKASGNLSEQADNVTQVYEIGGQSVAGAMQAFATETGRDTYILHNRVIALGMETVEDFQLQTVLDYFLRNHESRPMVDVVICRGKASELVGLSSVSYAIPAEQLGKLLDEGKRWGTVMRANMLDMQRALSGMWDAVIPIVSVVGEEEEQMARMDGTAVFRAGTYRGELDESATRGLLFARNELEQCLYVLPLEDGRSTTVELHSSDTDIRSERVGDRVHFTLSINSTAEITEETDLRPLTREQLLEIEKLLKERVEADVQAMLDKTIMEYGCDVLGLGRLLQKKMPDLVRGQETAWPERLKECTFSVRSSVKIKQNGMVAGEQGSLEN